MPQSRYEVLFPDPRSATAEDRILDAWESSDESGEAPKLTRLTFRRLTEREDNGRQLLRSDSPYLTPGIFVITDRARDALAPLLASRCHIVPIQVADTPSMFAVHAPLLDALDEQASKLRRVDGEVRAIYEYVFHAAKITSPIFRIASAPIGGPYMTDQFVEQWTKNKLVGVKFERIWRA